MTFIDIDGLTTAEAALWREVSDMNAEKPESWLCFVNAGHTMETARGLFLKGKIDCTKQMGMPVCRVRRPGIEDTLREYATVAGKDQMSVVPTDDLKAAADEISRLRQTLQSLT